MKILVLASFADSLIRFRGNLIQRLSKAGHEVFASAPDISDAQATELRSLGAVPMSVKLSRTGTNPLSDIFYFFRIVGLLRRLRPDKTLAYTMKPVIYGSIAARISRIGQFYSLITGLGYAFGEKSRRSLAGIVKSLLRLALAGNEAVVFQNPDDQALFRAQRLLRADTRTFVVNGSGVDTSLFARQPVPRTPAFLLIARLLVDKGVREYVAAAQIIRKSYPGVSFHLVGWLDSNPNSISQAELDDWVRTGIVEYHGALTDVREQIAQCSVYVLPSYREGTPRTVLEAMSIGRAIITTDAPGCKETVQHGQNGLLVRVGDVDSLASAIRQLINDPALVESMGNKSRAIAESKYDVRKVNNELMKIMALESSS